MIAHEHKTAPQPAGKPAPELEAPTTLAADQLEIVAAGTAASLFPGRPGPVSGLVRAEM